MPRFVLLYHSCPPTYERSSHWDLMLESGATLRTWAVARLPRAWAAWHLHTADAYPDCPPLCVDNSAEAERLPDHRLDYLEKEGPLTGGRGRVIRIERGAYQLGDDSPRELQGRLCGADWDGAFRLQQVSGSQWLLSVAPQPR